MSQMEQEQLLMKTLEEWYTRDGYPCNSMAMEKVSRSKLEDSRTYICTENRSDKGRMSSY